MKFEKKIVVVPVHEEYCSVLKKCSHYHGTALSRHGRCSAYSSKIYRNKRCAACLDDERCAPKAYGKDEVGSNQTADSPLAETLRGSKCFTCAGFCDGGGIVTCEHGKFLPIAGNKAGFRTECSDWANGWKGENR